MSEKRMAAMAEKMNLQDAVEEYCTMLRRRELDGSLPCAKKTAEILRLLITTQRHTDANALIDDIRNHGYRMQAAKPVELAIGNVVRRVLHIVREEAKQEELTEQQNMQPEVQPEVQKAAEPAKPQIGLLAQALRSHSTRFVLPRGVSLSNLLDVGIEDIDALAANRTNLSAAGAGAAALAAATAAADRMEVASEASTKQKRLKQAAQWPGKHEVIDAINELIDELDTIQNSITLQGVEYIHANEVILTFGMSDTTFYFLKEASKKREFQVVVAEGAPRFDGHIMARKLSDAGIQTTVIADSAVFAMMARANKVLVGAHAVLANGGVIAPVGIHMVALAAKRHSIPFVVLVGLHKLSPLFPHDPDLAYNDFKSPSAIIDFAVLAEAFSQQEALAHSLVAEPGAAPPRTFGFEGGNVHVPNPSFDYVPPHLISLFVTDMGGHTPSYVYRLLTEYYSREDYLLSKELFPSAR